MSRAKQLDVAAQQRRRGPHILSTILFLVAIGFAIAAIYLYWDQTQNSNNDPPAPTAPPGEYTAAQVKNALEAQGLKTDFGRSSGNIAQFPGVPGQALTFDDAEVYIFIFSGNTPDAAVQAAKDAYAAIDPETVTVTRISGAEIGADQPKHVFQGSNIVAVVIGGSDEEVQKVQAAIEGLP